MLIKGKKKTNIKLRNVKIKSPRPLPPPPRKPIRRQGNNRYNFTEVFCCSNHRSVYYLSYIPYKENAGDSIDDFMEILLLKNGKEYKVISGMSLYEHLLRFNKPHGNGSILIVRYNK